MIRKNVINPKAMNILCHEPQRHVQQQAISEPIPTPVPPKKSFWDRVWDKAKDIGSKICTGVKGFFSGLADILAPIAVVMDNANTITKDGKSLYDRFSKKPETNPQKKTQEKRVINIKVGELA